MGYRVEGDYVEACNCRVSCSCIYLAPATGEDCRVVFAWHIEHGEKDGVPLDGLNTVLAVRAPRQMTEGGWEAALYVDERAKAEQANALKAIFSGQAGGHLATVAPLIGKIAEVASARIDFRSQEGRRSVDMGDRLSLRAEEMKGADGKQAPTISNAPLGAVTQPVRQGTAELLRLSGPWSLDAHDCNSFSTHFAYEA
jgi:hypothetical protein